MSTSTRVTRPAATRPHASLTLVLNTSRRPSLRSRVAVAITVLPDRDRGQVGDLDAEADRGLPSARRGPEGGQAASSQSCTSRGVASTGTSPVAERRRGVSLGHDQLGLAAGADDDGHGFSR